jgi:hypothetical protein
LLSTFLSVQSKDQLAFLGLESLNKPFLHFRWILLAREAEPEPLKKGWENAAVRAAPGFAACDDSSGRESRQ